MRNAYRETTRSEASPLAIMETDQAELVATRRWWHRLSRTFYIGAALIVLIVLVAWAGPLFLPYDPLKLDMVNSLQSPSREHLLGTDLFGRDMLTRILYIASTCNRGKRHDLR
jgi:ABC-type dipeptide/oligopeptide/nickel transport system permease subunit